MLTAHATAAQLRQLVLCTYALDTEWHAPVWKLHWINRLQVIVAALLPSSWLLHAAGVHSEGFVCKVDVNNLGLLTVLHGSALDDQLPLSN